MALFVSLTQWLLGMMPAYTLIGMNVLIGITCMLFLFRIISGRTALAAPLRPEGNPDP
jgi:hypothetical protein